ncbi:MAG: L-seryl-tRNA(Sec) selenium transferase [Phycisphaerae bacterium]
MPSAKDLLRKIPGVDSLLEAMASEPIAAPRQVVVDAVRQAVDAARERLLAGAEAVGSEDGLRAWILADARRRLRDLAGPHYRKVVNATGIILHTALGRAVLAEKARRQIADELAGYSLLQADPETGKRSRRDRRIEDLLCRLTGAEAATVVNNNAAATLIVLNAVAGGGKEVIVSRGQLVEIGGSYRLPDVMAASGARMVEVGTTNKTHPRDYETAVTEETAAILRVHPSNYKIYGFTEEVPLATLREIADRHGLALIDDLGAGPLIDLAKYGFPKEPTLPESVRDGADLVTASADKLIGASQGGIILGRRRWVDAIRASPLARAVRVGKLTLAALEATLTLFLDEETALREVPTNRMLLRSLDDLDAQAGRIAEAVAGRTDAAAVEVADGFSQMGSGSLPTHDIPTRVVAVTPKDGSADDLARRLRLGSPPVFTRIKDGRVLVDPRTLQEGEDDVVVGALVRALAEETV